MFKKNYYPKISVVMNCHNGEKYLKQSIKSVLKQSYKNLELIFYDNKSNDKSVSIAKSFKDKRVKIFHSKNYQKLYKARNSAIKKTTGKFISFLDTDDWWLKNKLISQVHFFKKNKNIKIVYSKFFNYNENTKNKKINTKNLVSGKITQDLLSDYNVGILTVMICKSVFKKNKFNTNYNIIGDFDFFVRLSLKYSFYAIDKPLANYRSHDNNFSKIKKNEYINEFKYWLNMNDKKFKKKKINLTFPRLTLKKLQIKNFFG